MRGYSGISLEPEVFSWSAKPAVYMNIVVTLLKIYFKTFVVNASYSPIPLFMAITEKPGTASFVYADACILKYHTVAF